MIYTATGKLGINAWLTGVGALFCAVAAALAAGCSPAADAEGEVAPAESLRPIRLVNYDAGMARGETPLEESWDNFYVKAVKQIPGEGDVQDVIPGYRVSYAGGAWGYENEELGQYLKYWDLRAESYLFSAVAPAPDNSDGGSEGYRNTTVTISRDGVIDIDNVVGNLSTGNYQNSSNSPDWMVAQTRRVASPMADTDMRDASTPLYGPGLEPTELTAPVALRFHHVMARVDFLVFATTQLILQSFRVETTDGQKIVTRGDYSTDGGWTGLASPDDDTPLTYCNYTFLDGRVVSEVQAEPTLLSSHVQIPQSWLSTGRHLELTFVTKTGETFVGTITLDAATNNTNSWRENYHYRYVIKIDTTAEDTQVILFAVDMDTWKWKEGSTIEETQTDW